MGRGQEIVKYVQPSTVEQAQKDGSLAVFGLTPEFPARLRQLQDALTDADISHLTAMTFYITPDSEFPQLTVEKEYRQTGKVDVRVDLDTKTGSVEITGKTCYSLDSEFKRLMSTMFPGEPIELYQIDSVTKEKQDLGDFFSQDIEQLRVGKSFMVKSSSAQISTGITTGPINPQDRGKIWSIRDMSLKMPLKRVEENIAYLANFFTKFLEQANLEKD